MPADAGDDTERAAIVASVLHFEVGASAVGFASGRFEDGCGEKSGVSEDVGNEDRSIAAEAAEGDESDSLCLLCGRSTDVREHDFGELVFVRIADHGGDAGQRGNFFGSTLGIASGDNNFSQRILALHSADGGACILIRGVGYGA